MFFITMITSCALLDTGVDATVDDGCDDANLRDAGCLLRPGNYTYNYIINVFESCFLERIYKAHFDATMRYK